MSTSNSQLPISTDPRFNFYNQCLTEFNSIKSTDESEKKSPDVILNRIASLVKDYGLIANDPLLHAILNIAHNEVNPTYTNSEGIQSIYGKLKLLISVTDENTGKHIVVKLTEDDDFLKVILIKHRGLNIGKHLSEKAFEEFKKTDLKTLRKHRYPLFQECIQLFRTDSTNPEIFSQMQKALVHHEVRLKDPLTIALCAQAMRIFKKEDLVADNSIAQLAALGDEKAEVKHFVKTTKVGSITFETFVGLDGLLRLGS